MEIKVAFSEDVFKKLLKVFNLLIESFIDYMFFRSLYIFPFYREIKEKNLFNKKNLLKRILTSVKRVSVLFAMIV